MGNAARGVARCFNISVAKLSAAPTDWKQLVTSKLFVGLWRFIIMSASSKKFDFQCIVNNIKSIIRPEVATPNQGSGDPIGIKIAELSVLAQRLKKAHEEQEKELIKMNRLLNGLFRDIETLRNPLGSENEETRIEAGPEIKEIKEEEK